MRSTPHKELKFVQLNLHHAVGALKNLIQRSSDQCLSLACVQEMYQKHDIPVGVSARFKLFYSAREKLKAGKIIFDPLLPVMKAFTSRNVVAVVATIQKKRILVVSVYYPHRKIWKRRCKNWTSV
ncbi:hypothetical protein AVEN_242367-1 [Araneus ventricosus]|uniref:Uncharacterized protein n=1 Tax=Araneus ventricosus TaxID=182803 RepID=A0A4Y2MPZ7_ARAVE|nr:hypothetical protein AVEN_242367-1 [Araneus ventricosus]